ncbi:MAG: DUF47 domain-containing protein [Geminicoccaceae bacterium]
MPLHLFGRTKVLEHQIDEFLDTLSESALAFAQAVARYLDGGADEAFSEKREQVGSLESRGDDLRRAIFTAMYAEMLLPDLRGDVLKLLGSLDTIVNKFEETLWYFQTEKPEIPEDLHDPYQKLTDLSVASVESLCLACRAFFREVEAINDHRHKVLFYESDADRAVTQLRTRIFESDLPLVQKIHLRFFAERIVWISDLAEDVADELAIYALKRRA